VLGCLRSDLQLWLQLQTFQQNEHRKYSCRPPSAPSRCLGIRIQLQEWLKLRNQNTAADFARRQTYICKALHSRRQSLGVRRQTTEIPSSAVVRQQRAQHQTSSAVVRQQRAVVSRRQTARSCSSDPRQTALSSDVVRLLGAARQTLVRPHIAAELVRMAGSWCSWWWHCGPPASCSCSDPLLESLGS